MVMSETLFFLGLVLGLVFGLAVGYTFCHQQLARFNRELVAENKRLREAIQKSDREWYAKLEAADAEVERLRQEDTALEELPIRRRLHCPQQGADGGPRSPTQGEW